MSENKRLKRLTPRKRGLVNGFNSILNKILYPDEEIEKRLKTGTKEGTDFQQIVLCELR